MSRHQNTKASRAIILLPRIGLALLCAGSAWLALQRASDLRQRADRECTRLEALALDLAATFDGDAYRNLVETHAPGTAGAAPLPSAATLEQRAHLSGPSENSSDQPLRLLRLADSARVQVADAPHRSHTGAMEILHSDEDGAAWREATDYLPGMDQALFDGRSSALSDGLELSSYAPVLDLFGSVVGIVEVHRPIDGTLLSTLLLYGLGVLATLGLVVSFRRRPATRSKGEAPPALDHPARPVSMHEIARDLEARCARMGRADIDRTRAFLQAVFNRVKPGARRRQLRFRTQLPDGFPQDLGPRPAHVFAVLAELLDNAVRHSSPGGCINVRIAKDAEGRGLLFEVADQGEGISFEQQLLVRESIAAAAPGSYVRGGLTEASAILSALHGTIGLESRPAGGTRVWFTLPVGPRHGLRVLRTPA